MKASGRGYKWLTFLLALVTFIALIVPNSQGSLDPAMVGMFQPDEGVQLVVLEQMLTAKETPYLTVAKFLAYDYYFYGFPFFGSSALVILAVRALGMATDTAGTMLVLRQTISVLPTLLAILLLVYMQDRFRTWRSPALSLILIALPAVITNGMWWHPDGIVLLLVALTIYFLWRDEQRLGVNFFFAAISCGILTATKLIGVFFFLAIGLHLLWSVIEKKTAFNQAVQKGLQFIVVMAVAFVMANPFLLSSWGREQYFDIASRQALFLDQGYDLVYPKGPAATLPAISEYFGSYGFLMLAFAAAAWRVIKDSSRSYAALSFAWFLPISLYQLFTVHFKFQYWLPVLVPLLANLAIPKPESRQDHSQKRVPWLGIMVLLFAFLQTGLHIYKDVHLIQVQSTRADDNPTIQFYQEASRRLSLIEIPVRIYYDYRLYLPEDHRWTKDTSFEMLDYSVIQTGGYDVLLLQQQRMLDYSNPNAVGIDPNRLEASRMFYKDALSGKMAGYYLLYRSDVASIFISNQICQTWYQFPECQP